MQNRTHRKGRIRYLLLSVLLFCLIPSTGCIRSYRQSDIEAYLKEKYHLRSFIVSKDYLEFPDGDGMNDRLWFVVEMENSGFPFYTTLPVERHAFRVLDDHYYGLWADNSLRDDYTCCILQDLAGEYGAPANIQLTVEEGESRLFTAALTGTFQNEEELVTLCEEAEAFSSFAFENGYAWDIFLNFTCTQPSDTQDAESSPYDSRNHFHARLDPDGEHDPVSDAHAFFDSLTEEEQPSA